MNCFFRLVADDRIANRAEADGITPAAARQIEEEAGSDGLPPLTLPIRERDSVEYVDYLERPVPLLSDNLKRLVEKYMPDMRWRPAMLTDFRRMRQEVYWLASPPRIHCLSARSEFHKDGAVKRLVLEEGRNYRPLFQVEGIRERVLIVNLAVAESILRRDVYGVRLLEVDLDLSDWKGE